jgi:hypothetical protein
LLVGFNRPSFGENVLATIAEAFKDALTAYLSRAENAEAVRRIDSRCWDAWEQIQELLAAIAASLSEVASSPASAGYESLLMDRGYD